MRDINKTIFQGAVLQSTRINHSPCHARQRWLALELCQAQCFRAFHVKSIARLVLNEI
jgi:hypothetical protein